MGVKFGDAVRTARIERKIPLKRVADALDFSIPYVSDIELGHRNPPISEKTRQWAELIGIAPDDLEYLAMTDRKRIELPLEGHSQMKSDLAFSLARSWNDMTEDEEVMLLDALKTIEVNRK
jgi:transcriptional regulator with XRE-family HTH domain